MSDTTNTQKAGTNVTKRRPKKWKKKKGTKKRIVILGSSVAAYERGWSWHLSKALAARGHVIRNVSVGGLYHKNTQLTIMRFKKVVPQEKPDIVIIGLSLNNEGLLKFGQGAYDTFKKGMLTLIELIKQINAVPMLGSVYPCNNYKDKEYKLLLAMHQEMCTWGPVVFNFLTATDDGNGHWKKGTFFNAGHPNAQGHKLMFKAIPLMVFDEPQ